VVADCEGIDAGSGGLNTRKLGGRDNGRDDVARRPLNIRRRNITKSAMPTIMNSAPPAAPAISPILTEWAGADSRVTFVEGSG